MEPTPPPGEGAIRVTKDQVAAKTAESRQAFSSLMDKMEASRAQQGDYFVTFGEKTETDDQRILLLKKSVVDSNYATFIAVTRDGPMAMRYYSNDIKVVEDKIDLLEQDDMKNIMQEPGPDDSIIIKGKSKTGVFVDLTLHKPQPEKAEGLLMGAMDKSIAAAEAPHKQAFETAQNNIRLADMMAQKLGQLPPKE